MVFNELRSLAVLQIVFQQLNSLKSSETPKQFYSTDD